jgi:pimeloyl-ACP methyl ester carboxylesterase
MPTFTIPGPAGPLHIVDLREESPTPSGALPIVFVHGMAGHTGYWNSALAACADRRRAIAIDLRGHGNSAPSKADDYSVERCADDVFAAVDALGVDAAVLVGHSYGSLVVTEAAARRPKVVRRLILVDPPGDFTRVPAEVRDGEIAPYLAKLDGDGWRSAVENSFDEALQGSTVGGAAMVRARLATMPRSTMRSMYHSMFAYRASAALERYLAEPGNSVHAILAPPNAWPFSLHVLVPALHTTVVDNVVHWIMLDAPDRFVAALDAALAGT